MQSRVVCVLGLTASGWFVAVHARPATRVLMPTPESEPNNTLTGLGLVASAFLLVRRL